ncbi:MAG: hypothetical protein EXS58_14600 [Candidatus Latescibacteria bacterium]|nr:hypothetical protein [Candidatus Latescibacterota bacterium]
MTNPLRSTYEGPAIFIATDRNPKPIKVGLECPAGLAYGTDVRISISTFHSYTFDWSLDGFAIERGKGRVVLGHDLPRDWTDWTRGGVGPAGGGLIGRPLCEVYLCTVQITQSLSPGAHLVFSLRVVSSVHADVQGDLLVKVRHPGSEFFEQVGEPIPLPNSPGEATRLEARISAGPDTTGKVRAVVFATDEYLNPLPQYRGTLRTKTDGQLKGFPEEIEIGPEHGGRRTFGDLTLKGDGPSRIEVRDPLRGFEAQSGPVVAPPIGARQHFFGGIHFHTRLSVDGDREPSAAYAYARDYLNLDVVAMTDHAPIGPGWEECLAVNEAFYEPGRFVTLPAWESSNAYGHANVYLRSREVDVGTWYWDPEVNPSEVAWPPDVVVVPHHPTAGQVLPRGKHRELLSKGIYWTEYDWSFPNDRVRLVEVLGGGGNYESSRFDAAWGIAEEGQGSSIQDAFARGWRLGFTGGTDNHEGHPTQLMGRYVDLTCFRATELTREAIWQAMDQRQTYATSGVPIVCDYSVNGVPLGGEKDLAPGEEVHFSARLHGTAPIALVEIISGGRCVWQGRPNAWDVELEGIELPAPEGEWAYYYLRLRQADGHRALLSPVWLDRRT